MSAIEAQEVFEVEGVVFRHLRNGNRTRVILEMPYDEDAHVSLSRLNGKRVTASLTEIVEQAEIDFEGEEVGA